MNFHILISLVLGIVLLAGCDSGNERNDAVKPEISSQEGKLFKLLNSSKTGLSFRNKITEDYEVNSTFNTYLYNGGGVGIIDVNNDSLPDIFMTSTQETNRLFLNKGALVFEDITESAGLTDVGNLHTGVAIVDINNDGFQDVYVCKSGHLLNENRRNLLYINNGDNTFSEKAKSYGIDDLSSSNNANFFDFDLDGDLDLYLLNYPNNFAWTSKGEIIRTGNEKRPSLAPQTPYDTDRFYKNNGNGTFTDITKTVGVEALGFGLSATVIDINNDLYPDIYIANDFIQEDILYVNQKNGTFRNELSKYFLHTSASTMGVDVGDVNNDGLQDLVTLDMRPEDFIRQKTLMSDMVFSKYSSRVSNGYGEQYGRNQLQINNGVSNFSELGCLSDIFQTDWSWAPLLQDFDNDGETDLYITNGYFKSFTDFDFMNFVGADLLRKGGITKKNVPDIEAFYEKIPSVRIKNYIYKNKGDLTFDRKENDWMVHPPSFSNGAAYADFDLDGDIDLVVNNIEDEAFFFENKASENGNNFLQIKLKGASKNLQAVGAKVRLSFADGKTQLKDLHTSRGFLSSVEPLLHFGLGKTEQVEKIEVLWPDGKISTLSDQAVNKRIHISYDSSKKGSWESVKPVQPIFKKEDLGIAFLHKENDFVDFNSYRLLPHELSRTSPKIAVGDVTGDGLEDFYIGNGFGSSSGLFHQTSSGSFRRDNSAIWELSKSFEETDVVFSDFDNDGDKDILAVTGGHEASDPKAWRLRIYGNEGNGSFAKNAMNLLLETCPGVVRAFDFDKDGKEDIFIGGRVKSTQYPYSPKSFIYKNSGGGNLNEVSATIAPFFANLGMVTDIQFADLDGVPGEEMVVVGEWMGVRVFSFQNGVYVEISEKLGLQNTEGWWNCVTIDDFDNDGDQDLFAGNLGLNTRFRASKEEPIEMYAYDFDKNGSIDPIMAFYENGEIYPYAQKDDMIAQLPHLKKKYLYYKDYAQATIKNIFSETELENSLKLKVSELSTSVFINENGKFIKKALPNIAQSAPVYQILIDDFTGDGNKDVLLAGNDHGYEVETAHCDASLGVLLKRDGKNGFKFVPNKNHGLIAGKEVRDMKIIRRKNKKDLILIANNSSETQVFSVLK